MSLNYIARRRSLFRGGFTLVELLVVIAIIGVLVGLLLPAVQAAREAARRCMCSNNIAQIGLALHHYEFNAEHLPSGVSNPTGPIRNEPIGQHVGWLVKVMPQLEQQAVYNHFDQAVGVYGPANAKVRQSSIKTLLCPSSPNPTRGGSGTAAERWAITNYAGCYHDSEAPIDADNNGVLFLNSRLRFSEIRDGSSQTILLGEMVPDSDDLGWASGTRSSLRNTGSFKRPLPMTPAGNTAVNGTLIVGGFGSFHSGGANFAFADGSVHFLSYSTPPNLLKQLGNRADGELLLEETDVW